MERKKIIRKIWVLAAWLLVISGMTTLLIAADRKQKTHSCRQVLIGIKGSEDKSYIGKEDVLTMIEKTSNGSLLNRSVTTIDLTKLEEGLRTNPWIKKAELYFDSKDALHVSVEERQPVVRVFTTAGNSFYMDSSGHQMPLLEKISIRVPVVTGFTNAKKFNKADSILLNEVEKLTAFIYSNQFWNAQIGQIDITADKKFELIPVIGNHIIKLGDAENIEQKLNRLYIFYKQVMRKVGFDKYAAVDIEYDGQVIAVKREPSSPVDSIQLKKNIEELMNKANLQNIDEEMLPQQNDIIKTDSAVSKMTEKTNSVSTKTNPIPIVLHHPIAIGTNQNAAKKKTIIQSKPFVKKEIKINVRTPKAVMKKVSKSNGSKRIK